MKMFRFAVIFATLLATAVASHHYGSGGGMIGSGIYGGSSYGGGCYHGCGSAGSYRTGLLGGGSSYGFGSYGGGGMGGGGGGGGLISGGGGGGGLVTGAVQSRRSVSFYDVPSTFSGEPMTIELPSSAQPLNFLMRTQSSPINVQADHVGSGGSYQETASVDEPHVRVHTVTRPVVQRLNEIIQPYRQIRQQVNPVQEDVQAVVARGQGYGGGGYGGFGGGGSLGGGSGGSTGFYGYGSPGYHGSIGYSKGGGGSFGYQGYSGCGLNGCRYSSCGVNGCGFGHRK